MSNNETLIRVRLRRGHDDKEILLSFDKTKSRLHELLERAAKRLKMRHDDIDSFGLFVDYGDSQVLVDNSNDIFHDDRLILKHRTSSIIENQVEEAEATRRILVSPVKRNPNLDRRQTRTKVKPGSDQLNASNKAAVASIGPLPTNEDDESDEEISVVDDDSESEEESNSSDEEKSDLEEDSVSDFDDESSASIVHVDTAKRTSGGGKKGAVGPTLEVHIAPQDLPDAPGTHVDDMPDKDYEYQPALTGASKADNEVKERIMKLLNMGFHDGSNENEAKRAMKMAQKLMKRHNLSQALLLKERDAQGAGGSELLKGGLVNVHVKNLRSGKASLFLRWFSKLAKAINKSFGVSMFYQAVRGYRCRITFYGIYTNCQLAAYAFKTAAERISMMQAAFVPEKKYGVTTSSARLWYAMGIASGLETQANNEVDREEEAHQRKLSRARQAESKGEAYEDSDGEVEDVDDESVGGIQGFSIAVHLIPPATLSAHADHVNSSASSYPQKPVEPVVSSASDSASHPQASQTRLAELEKMGEAAIVLADQNEKIQEEVLKDQGIKLSAGRKKKSLSSYDGDAFRKGETDSQEISLKRRAIRDDWTKHVKKEKNA